MDKNCHYHSGSHSGNRIPPPTFSTSTDRSQTKARFILCKETTTEILIPPPKFIMSKNCSQTRGARPERSSCEARGTVFSAWLPPLSVPSFPQHRRDQNQQSRYQLSPTKPRESPAHVKRAPWVAGRGSEVPKLTYTNAAAVTDREQGN